jgi:ATP-dependent Lhr-like helicase
MNEQALQAQIKQHLRRTYHTFFGRFPKLTEIQRKAIPVVMDGRNVILVSTTASGKTEAVVAPICEKLLADLRRGGPSILYITPTRALANDLYERLHEKMNILNIRLDRKTGDKPVINWKKAPDVLITTPESLDSILCRHPSALLQVRTVILDEIHLLDGTYRGDQVRLLLRRLRKWSPHFSMYALSATIMNPKTVASRYMDQPVVISTPGSRTIKESYVNTLGEAYNAISKERIKKVIIFCNRRKIAEKMGVHAKEFWPPNEVVVHHGALSKSERLESERVMKTLQRAVCAATMTLEIGIDIGDVEAVVLAEVPWDVISLVQRIGRAGRRSGIIRVFAICSDDKEKLEFHELMDKARQNLLEEYRYIEDLSVVIQQIYSILYSNPGGVPEEQFVAFFEGFCPKNTLTEAIIPHLINEEKILRRLNKLYASEKVMNLGEWGKVHSNIPNTTALEVIDTSKKQSIGEIQFRTDILRENERFVLAGKIWEIETIEKYKIYVRPSKKDASPADFAKTQVFGAFFFDLPENIRDEEIRKRSKEAEKSKSKG